MPLPHSGVPPSPAQLHGRKLWRLFPPDQTRHLHPAKTTEGGTGAPALPKRRLGEAISGSHAPLRPHPKAWGCPPHLVRRGPAPQIPQKVRGQGARRAPKGAIPAAFDHAGAHYAADVLTADVALYPDLMSVERGVEHVLTPGQLLLVPEGWAHAVHNLDDTAALTCAAHSTAPASPPAHPCIHARVHCRAYRTHTHTHMHVHAHEGSAHRHRRSDPARRYNFVDEANLRCHLALLRPAAGQKLRRLFHTHQAQGVPADEAAAQAAHEPLLAYYAHLHAIAAAQPLVPTVRVAEAHLAWEDFFGRQGPYKDGGGVAALERTAATLATQLVGLLATPPPPGATPKEDADALLFALSERIEQDLAERRFQKLRMKHGPDEL